MPPYRYIHTIGSVHQSLRVAPPVPNSSSCKSSSIFFLLHRLGVLQVKSATLNCWDNQLFHLVLTIVSILILRSTRIGHFVSISCITLSRAVFVVFYSYTKRLCLLKGHWSAIQFTPTPVALCFLLRNHSPHKRLFPALMHTYPLTFHLSNSIVDAKQIHCTIY